MQFFTDKGVIRGIRKNGEVFCNDPEKSDSITHDIELTSDILVKLRDNQNSPRQAENLKPKIKRMLELGVVIEVESEYDSSMILVGMPGRDPRALPDYRNLNAITYPKGFLPNKKKALNV